MDVVAEYRELSHPVAIEVMREDEGEREDAGAVAVTYNNFMRQSLLHCNFNPLKGIEVAQFLRRSFGPETYLEEDVYENMKGLRPPETRPTTRSRSDKNYRTR